MGRAPRPKPSRLGEKLLQVRTGLELSQTQMCRALGLNVDYSAVSQYERGTREPPLPVLLKYARLAGVIMDVLVDDEMDLPGMIPAPRRRGQVGDVKTERRR
jgi:transcriptional regulator with XRE-family HTH domain